MTAPLFPGECIVPTRADALQAGDTVILDTREIVVRAVPNIVRRRDVIIVRFQALGLVTFLPRDLVDKVMLETP